MSRPCLCDQCDLSPWSRFQPHECRLCWLYHHDPEYRDFWDGEQLSEEPTRRALPCIHLGAVLDRRGCPCPGLWLRGCFLHGPITIQTCKTCPDYEEDA